jgi:hypothetical protein
MTELTKKLRLVSAVFFIYVGCLGSVVLAGEFYGNMMKQGHSLHALDNQDKCSQVRSAPTAQPAVNEKRKLTVSPDIDVTGVWKGKASTYGATADLTVSLTQAGAVVAGTWKSKGAYPTICGEWTGEFNGTVNGNIFTVNATSPIKDLDTCEILCWDPLDASLVVSGYTMTGTGTEVDCQDGTSYSLDIVLSRACSPDGDEAIAEKITDLGQCPPEGTKTPTWGRFGPMQELVADSGEKLSVECHDGKYFLLLYTAPGQETHKVGLCPFWGGCNSGYFWHSGDRDGNNKPDCFIRTRWISRDYGNNDKPNAWTGQSDSPLENVQPPIVDLLDWAESVFDVNTLKLTKTDLKYEYAYGPPVSGCGSGPSPEGNLFNKRPVTNSVIDPPVGPDTETFYDTVIARLLNLPAESVPMGEDTSPKCDLNRDGVCDAKDRLEFVANIGKCLGDLGYNPFADIDGDGCLTTDDLRDLSLADQGTIGTQLTLTGTGFGAKKGKVFIGGVAAKVTTWGDTSITCLLTKVPPAGGPYDVTITPKKASIITISSAFTVMNSELDPLSVDHGTPGTSITMTGKFFSTKKGKVHLEDPVSGKKKTCKVTNWNMEPTTGASTLTFEVPKLPKGFNTGVAYPLKIANKVGTAQTTFTVDPTPP